MSRRGKRVLLAMILTGVVIRVVIAFATVGSEYDMASFRLVARELDAPSDIYSTVNGQIEFEGETGTLFRWPYAPAFFPWIYASEWLADHSALAFHGLVQLPAIAADVAIALLILWAFGQRRVPERTRLAAAGLVLLGPSFIAISGYHGQIDSLAILPAVAGVLAWERAKTPHRATVAGSLLGAGAALKTVPAFMILALLPTARTVPEGVRLTAVTAAVPLAMLLPFAITDFAGVRDLTEYGGAPGAGGLSLALQPGLATDRWLLQEPFHLSGASELLGDYGSIFLGIVLLLLGVAMIRWRTPPVTAAICVWLVVWIFGPGFFLQYLVWGLPFIILAGRLVEAAALQAAVLVPTILFYLAPWENDDVAYLYVPIMIGVWLAMIAALALIARRAYGRRPSAFAVRA